MLQQLPTAATVTPANWPEALRAVGLLLCDLEMEMEGGAASQRDARAQRADATTTAASRVEVAVEVAVEVEPGGQRGGHVHMHAAAAPVSVAAALRRLERRGYGALGVGPRLLLLRALCDAACRSPSLAEAIKSHAQSELELQTEQAM